MVAGQREAHELLLIEEADAWFEYLEATRAQSALRYKEVEPKPRSFGRKAALSVRVGYCRCAAERARAQPAHFYRVVGKRRPLVRVRWCCASPHA